MALITALLVSLCKLFRGLKEPIVLEVYLKQNQKERSVLQPLQQSHHYTYTLFGTYLRYKHL